MNQTPASRRFLAPTTKSRQQQSSSSSSHRARRVQPSQSTSSSPFWKTPLANKSRDQDVIEAVGDDLSVDFPPTITTKSTTRYRRSKDYIEDEDEGDEGQQAAINDARDLTENVRFSKQLLDIYDDGENPNSFFHEATIRSNTCHSSPLPKRQKCNHGGIASTDPIRVSSSPPSAEEVDPDIMQEATAEQQLRNNANYEDRDLATSQKAVSKDTYATGSKFRIKAAPHEQDDVDGTQFNRPRSVFKSMPSTLSNSSELLLPAAFSPSKRKGRQEYIYGGFAETVRSWILDVAHQQQSSHDLSRSPMMSFKSAAGFTDSSGRFQMITDEQSQSWMLINQDPEKGLQQGTNRVNVGDVSTIHIQGNGTCWPIHSVPRSLVPGDVGQVNVAVLWQRNAH